MDRSRRISSILSGAASVAMIVASVVVTWVAISFRAAATPTAATRVEGIENVELEPPLDVLKDSTTKGSAAATLILLEFNDFQCLYCARFAQETYPQIERDFVDSGQLQYVFLNFPLKDIHPLALRAAVTAECAGEQGRYSEMREWLFANQIALTADILRVRTKSFAVGQTSLQQCVGDNRMALRIQNQRAFAQQLGIRSTPTFLIGKLRQDGTVALSVLIRGAQPFPVFERQLRRVLH